MHNTIETTPCITSKRLFPGESFDVRDNLSPDTGSLAIQACRYHLTCPQDMTMSCPEILLPSSQGCRNADFIVNGNRLCGRESHLRNAVNVGRTVNALLYSDGSTRSSLGIQCKITCGCDQFGYRDKFLFFSAKDGRIFVMVSDSIGDKTGNRLRMKGGDHKEYPAIKTAKLHCEPRNIE
ncbi:unnamed protein product, partial [Darwinula stevensoni]